MNTNIRPNNDKGQRHGYWESYWNDKLFYKCTFHNDKEIGYEEYYPNDYEIIKSYHII